MSFAWPPMLAVAALGTVVLVATYAFVVRRRSRSTPESPLRPVRSYGARRQLPAALALTAIALLLVALARPSVVLALPRREGTVILALDVSSSMEATDLKPTRMEAAKEAASAFVRKQPATIQIGVVAFSDTALVLQEPTSAEADVLAAISRIQPQGGTSLSAGMLTALNAIAGTPANATPTPGPAQAPARPAYYGSALVVLLSDGEDTSRADPMAAASQLSDAGVHLDTIGIGTPQGSTVQLAGYTIATALNQQLLSQVASATGGTYYSAADSTALAKVYDSIGRQLVVRGQRTEVTALVAGAAIVLLMLEALLSIRWAGRVP